MRLCTVFRSSKQAETYLYLAHGRSYDDLPAELRQAFGKPTVVMQLNLSEKQRLARVNVHEVMAELDARGFYLQLPPEIPIEEEITRRFSE